MRSRRTLLRVVLAVCAVVAVGLLVPRWLEHGNPAPVARSVRPHTPTAATRDRPTRAPLAARSVCRPRRLVPLGTPARTYAVTVTTRAVVYRRPDHGRIAAFGHLNINGVPTVFGVLAARFDRSCRAVWYRVQLPLRPNGRTGWVRSSAVSMRQVDTRILVDLSLRKVTLFRDGRPVFVTTAAIGSNATPTPTGRYYVNQKLVAPDPWGAYGPAAIGISAFSPVLQDWAQGGPIAIHGTNQSALLGSAVSHGCIRISNADVLRLFHTVPTGTPVLIRM